MRPWEFWELESKHFKSCWSWETLVWQSNSASNPLFPWWPDDLPKQKSSDAARKGSLLEYTASEEKEEERRWRMYQIGDQGHRVDMKAIEPYKKVISHGGECWLIIMLGWPSWLSATAGSLKEKASLWLLFFFPLSLGYYGDGLNAIIVFAVCFMPESSQPNYRYLMDNLFK